MIRGKRLLSLLLVAVMCFGLALQCQASEIRETKKKGEQLEEKKEKAEELAGLQTQLEELEQQNKDIEKTIKENDKAAIAEKYARENGYVKTDERVYIDITPGT